MLKKMIDIHRKEGREAADVWFQSLTDEQREQLKNEFKKISDNISIVVNLFVKEFSKAAKSINKIWENIPEEIKRELLKNS